jgi:hypothetical protein
MTPEVKRLQERAKRKLRSLQRRRRSERYRMLMGRLVHAGLLMSNDDLPDSRGAISIKDALWVGEVEPRVLELLPAMLLKRPALFVDPAACPDDLAAVVASLRRGQAPPAFRGIDGAAVARWLPLVGRRNKLPTRLQSFRLTPSDQQLLTQLADTLGTSKTDVIRRGLRAIAARELLGKDS